MKILIANCKTWFSISDSLKSVHQIEYISRAEELNHEYLGKYKPEIIFFPHWNWIVPANITQQYHCIGFHTGPLPHGRGGSPIQNLILRRVEATPVNAIRLNEKLDGGNIYCKIEVSLAGTLSEIFERMNRAINRMITQILLNKFTPQVQEVTNTTPYRRLTIEDNRISLDQNLEEIYDRIRMVDHHDYPNAFLELDEYIIEFSRPTLIGNTIECNATIKSK